jgi:hypothetical protein
VEDHPYLMSGGYFGKLTFQMSDLESRDGTPRPGKLPSDTNPPLVNEYGWLWLNRDGTPTRLTEGVYSQLMGDDTTARERLDMWAYLLAGKTEFWRAHRHYAGIIHFVYLTCSYPGVYTSDHFHDVTTLQLDPAFVDYVGQAFQPLGVYINFFQPKLAPGESRSLKVMMVNDYAHTMKGRLTLELVDSADRVCVSQVQPFELPAAGNGSYDFDLQVPPTLNGKCTLRATAVPEEASGVAPTISRRWLVVE